jgi:predicted membrane protein
VESSHLYLGATVTAYVFAAQVLGMVAAAAAAYVPGLSWLAGGLYWPLRWLAAMVITMGVYAALAPGLRLKPLNRVFTYTSLTHYWRRYLAPGIKPRDFARP